MKENYSKYIGIPFVFNGDTFDGADCAGLVSLFYKEHGINIDYPKPKHKNWYEIDKFYMQRYLMENFIMSRDINDIKPFDILYYLINGEGHLGVALEYGRVLMTYPKINEFNGGASFIDRYKYWFGIRGVEFKAVFKRK